MKNRFSLLVAAAFLITSPALMANDAPPADAPPVPAPEQQTTTTKAPAAKKEDEEFQESVGFFKSLFGKKKTAPTGATNDIATLRATIDDLNAAVATKDAEIQRLAAENTRLQAAHDEMERHWPAIEAALAAGKPDAPALQTETGKKVAAAAQTATLAAMAATGHDPAALPGPGAKKPDNSAAAPAGPRATDHYKSHWASKGWEIPGLNQN